MSENHTFNRRATDATQAESKVKTDIINQMGEVEDQDSRVLLTLLLRLHEEMTQSFNAHFVTLNAHLIQIHTEIAKLQRTDDQIKTLVLNGHTEVHTDDHNWIAQQRKIEAACGLVLNKHGEDGLCEHARQMIEDAKVAKVRRWKVMDGLAEKLILVLLGILAAAMFPHLKF